MMIYLALFIATLAHVFSTHKIARLTIYLWNLVAM